MSLVFDTFIFTKISQVICMFLAQGRRPQSQLLLSFSVFFCKMSIFETLPYIITNNLIANLIRNIYKIIIYCLRGIFETSFNLIKNGVNNNFRSNETRLEFPDFLELSFSRTTKPKTVQEVLWIKQKISAQFTELFASYIFT